MLRVARIFQANKMKEHLVGLLKREVETVVAENAASGQDLYDMAGEVKASMNNTLYSAFKANKKFRPVGCVVRTRSRRSRSRGPYSVWVFRVACL